jgi:hypothetical protein
MTLVSIKVISNLIVGCHKLKSIYKGVLKFSEAHFLPMEIELDTELKIELKNSSIVSR